MYFDRQLWRFTDGVRARILGSVVIGLAAALVGIVRLALLGWLLAKVFSGEPAGELVSPILAVAFVMLLRGFLEYWRNMVAHETAAQVQRTLRKHLYNKIVELGPAHFGLERTGEALLSVAEGVEQLEVYFGQYLPQLVVAFFVPVCIFGFVAFLDMPVALVMVGFALFTLIAPAAFHSWDSHNARKRQRAYAQFGAEFLDSLQGLATLQAFGQSGTRAGQLADQARELFRRTMWVLATNSLTRGITDIGIAVGAAVMLLLGAHRVSEGSMSLAALLMILLMGTEVFRPLRDLRALLHDGMLGRSAAEGILALLAKQPLIPPTVGRTDRVLVPSIDFENVSFSYPGTRTLAHDRLNFSVAQGERVGIVGPSGCGKSTILKLLLRLYDPQQGVVRIGGQDLKALARDDIYDHVAVVSQDPYLFHGTVRDNLLFGKVDATDEELIAGATTANAHGFITQLPEGYDTVIGERGIKLSGGQRQRLAIARAVLRDAPILVLDEALSSVDSENESLIQQALDAVMENRTTLIFAHRLSSVADADRILVLQHGRLVESGTHTELMQTDGAYHDLMSGQIESYDETEAGRVEYIPSQRAPAEAERNQDQKLYLEPTDGILKAEGLGWSGVIRALFTMIMPWRGKLALTFALGVVRVAAYIGVGVISALIVAAVKNDTDYQSWLVALAIVAPLAGIFHWLESWIAHDMAFRLLAELRIALFSKLDALGPAYLVRRRSGDLVAAATHDVELVEYFFAHTVAPAFVAVLVPSAVIITLLLYGWQLALVLAPFLLVVGLSPFMLRHRLDRLGSQTREALGNLNAHVVDTIQGLAEILAFRQVDHRRREFLQRIDAHHRLRLPFFRDLTLQMAILEVATGLGGLAVVTMGAVLVNRAQIDAAYLPLLTILAMSAFLPVSEIAHIGRQLADTLGATRRLYAVHNEPTVVFDGPDSGQFTDGSASAGLRNVSFSYFANRHEALHDVNFTADEGRMLALVGPSGAGKTTIAHLLMRFWDPCAGRVEIQGIDLRSAPLEEVRDRIALVTQDTYLFNDTLGANIRIANPTASVADLDRAIDNAALRSFIDSLPDGMETRVGERGVRLSGGQRQRVAIARAFLKDAPILILDEATSHLDAISERLVHQSLETLMRDRTTIVIAHRLSTIRNAAQILVLENGHVVEKGGHDELMTRDGLYRHLVARQLSSAPVAATAQA